ncbi:MAG: hypothetical protein JSU68_12865 [Phycisphaerales bacterium]|nr:MAG: hypothetical protein JSU68_12865 [Phycisphaerales bacterium]
MEPLASIDWNNVFQQPIPVFMLAAIVALAYIIAGTIRKIVAATELTRLKQMMVERGYSPEDIVRVVSAGEQPGRKPQVHAAVLRGTPAAAVQCCSEDACC